MPPARWPTKTVAKRARAVERIAQDLRANEDDAGLPETRLPDPGFTPYAYDWASGDALADVLDDDEMTGGDFVRHVKQCIDLLRQVGDVAADDETRARSREAADACFRGVVAASSVAAT
jgi:ATP-dependent RNA helicase HelY